MASTILIVDDEPMLTDLLSEHLKQNGYLTYTANNSAQALEQLRHKPDLILLDINMPGTDGLELCKQIRSHVVCPILFLTARITELDQINGFQVGGDDYITKPFRLHELTSSPSQATTSGACRSRWSRRRWAAMRAVSSWRRKGLVI